MEDCNICGNYDGSGYLPDVETGGYPVAVEMEPSGPGEPKRADAGRKGVCHSEKPQSVYRPSRTDRIYLGKYEGQCVSYCCPSKCYWTHSSESPDGS